MPLLDLTIKAINATATPMIIMNPTPAMLTITGSCSSNPLALEVPFVVVASSELIEGASDARFELELGL